MKKRFLCGALAILLLCSALSCVVYADSVWELQSSVEVDAFWGYAATVADLCSAFTSLNLPITWEVIYFYVGATVLGQLASSTYGCTFYLETYTFQIPGQPIQYLYKWTMVDSLGNSHGPYRYQPNVYVASLEEENINE